MILRINYLVFWIIVQFLLILFGVELFLFLLIYFLIILHLEFFLFILFCFPFLLISISCFNGESFVYVFQYILSFLLKQKLFLYFKNTPK